VVSIIAIAVIGIKYLMQSLAAKPHHYQSLMPKLAALQQLLQRRTSAGCNAAATGCNAVAANLASPFF